MKKSIVLIVLVVMVGLVLTAAVPVPPPTQFLQGKLNWQHNNICGVSDYVSTEAMTNVYLTGKFSPSGGVLVGCQIQATGFFYRAGRCEYFDVSTYKTACPTNPLQATDH